MGDTIQTDKMHRIYFIWVKNCQIGFFSTFPFVHPQPMSVSTSAANIDTDLLSMAAISTQCDRYPQSNK